MSKMWYPTLDQCAQLAHFAIGLAIVWGTVACLGISPWWGVLAVHLVFAAKEFGYDTLWPVVWGGEGDPWASSLKDYGFYLLGAYLALGAVLLASK